MTAEILTIGDELLIGQVVNGNAAWLGERLTLAGIDVSRHVALGDDEALIAAELETAFALADLVIVTGGLGATHDDLTRAAVARHFGVELIENPQVRRQIEERFSSRGRSMPPQNRLQALVPEGFEVLVNHWGTAPGLWHAFERDGAHKVLVLMPGVPREMRSLTDAHVMPRLAQQRGLRTIRHRTLMTAGIGETHLAQRLGDLSAWLSDTLHLAYLPSTTGVRLRVTALGDEANARMGDFEQHLRRRAARHVYGADEETLEGVLGEQLALRGLTVATAESCTGGHLADRITNAPGSSRYFTGGLVAYGNFVKETMLGVPPELVRREGAVSAEVAAEMAVGVRRQLSSDIGLSTTGIAGPGGGTEDKPVGLVYIGYADAERSFARRFQFTTDRTTNKDLTATYALYIAWRVLHAGHEAFP
jgi:nicotinamide-nucleotide amidase